MMTERLLSFLNSLSPTSVPLDAEIRARVIKEQFKRGHILSSPIRGAHAIWFIVSGLAKEYYYDDCGKMVITAFWRENELMVNTDSFFGKKRSEKYIELVEDSMLLAMESKQAHQLQALYPEVQTLGYAILSAAKTKDSERSQLIGLSARESNKQFCKMFPAARISVSDAASYLGLIRTTLSTIRSQEAKSKSSSTKR